MAVDHCNQLCHTACVIDHSGTRGGIISITLRLGVEGIESESQWSPLLVTHFYHTAIIYIATRYVTCISLVIFYLLFLFLLLKIEFKCMLIVFAYTPGKCNLPSNS